MPHKEIKDRLDELKTEVENTPKETSVFEDVLHDAREGLERYTPEALKEFSETLQREAADFEVEHPRITEMINNVVNALTSLGI